MIQTIPQDAQSAALRGQRDVLLQLLREDADEDQRLRELRDRIADACGGVMLSMVKEKQR